MTEEADKPPKYEVDVSDTELLVFRPDLDDVPPPPAYEPPQIEGNTYAPCSEVPVAEAGPMQTTETGASTNVPGPTTLGFVDFLPQCTIKHKTNPQYQDFKVLMSVVNDWLSHNPNYTVIRCECLDRPVDKWGAIQAVKTIWVQGHYTNLSFVRGIRLWLTLNNGTVPPQTIWYMNAVPSPTATKDENVAAVGDQPSVIGGNLSGAWVAGKGPRTNCVDMIGQQQNMAFEGLDELMVKFNANLKSNPVPGRVLNINCNNMMYSVGHFGQASVRSSINPDNSYWSCDADKVAIYMQFLRVFYVCGPPETVQLGLQDFVPDLKKAGTSWEDPVFETQSELIAKSTQWINKNQNVRVTNVLTVSSKMTDNGINPRATLYNTGRSALDTEAERVSTMNRNLGGRRLYNSITDPKNTKKQDGCEYFMRFIRVAYVKPGNCDMPFITSRAFIPVRHTLRTSEPLAALLTRINTWLLQSRTQILSVDTVDYMFPVDLKIPIDTETSASTVQRFKTSKGQYWIVSLQIYFKGPIQEGYAPIPAFGPPLGQPEASTCSIL